MKALLSFPGLVSLVYLCTGFPFDGDAEAEERQQKVGDTLEPWLMTLLGSTGFRRARHLVVPPSFYPSRLTLNPMSHTHQSAQAGSAGKALKKSISSKKSSSSISPKNNGAGKNKSPKQGATGSGKATGSGSRNKKWHEEEGEEEGQDGDEETGHAAQVVEEEGEAEEEDPFPPKKKGGGASPKSTSPKG